MNVRKLISSVTILLVYLLAGLGFTSCEKEVEGVTEIIFTNVRSGKIKLSVGEEFAVKYLVMPEHLQETAEIDWETSDRKVARVRKGVIEAEGPGEATITASSGDTKATILVTVSAIQVEDFAFHSEGIEVYLDATVKVTFEEVSPSDGSLTTVEWVVGTEDEDGGAEVTADDNCIYVTGTRIGVVTLYGYIDGVVIDRQEIVIKERIPVTSVSVTLSEQTVQYGGSLTVSTYVQPFNASLKDVVITCTPSNLATVSGNTITAGNQAGTVTVRATADGVSGTAEFEIVAPPLTLTIKGEGFGDGNSYNFLSPDTSVGNFPTSARLVLSANYEGVDLSKAVWTSSDANIVKVDTDGKVTGMGHGTAVVTAEVDGVKATYTVRSVKKSSFGIKFVNYYGKTPVSSISTPEKIYIVDYFDPAFASDRNAFDFGLYNLYKVNLSTNGDLTAHFEGNSAVIRADSPCSGSVTFSLDNGKSVNLPVTMKVQSLTFIGVDTGKPYGTVQKGDSLSILHKDTNPKPGSGTFEAIRVYCNVGTSYEEGVSVLADAYSWKSNNSSTDPFGYGTIQWNNPEVGTHVITMTDFDPTFSITLTVDYEDF